MERWNGGTVEFHRSTILPSSSVLSSLSGVHIDVSSLSLGTACNPLRNLTPRWNVEL